MFLEMALLTQIVWCYTLKVYFRLLIGINLKTFINKLVLKCQVNQIKHISLLKNLSKPLRHIVNHKCRNVI